MAKKPSKHSLDAGLAATSGDDAGDQDMEQLTEAIRALVTIEGVEGVGQPVTLIFPADLPFDFLGFVERLRGGAVEVDDEMLLITLAAGKRPRRARRSAKQRLRETLMLLGRHAVDNNIAMSEVLALFDETRLKLSKKSATRRED